MVWFGKDLRDHLFLIPLRWAEIPVSGSLVPLR